MKKAKEFLSGKKTYLICVATIIGIVVAWSQDTMTTQDAILGIVAAVAGITAKAGITRDIKANK